MSSPSDQSAMFWLPMDEHYLQRSKGGQLIWDFWEEGNEVLKCFDFESKRRAREICDFENVETEMDAVPFIKEMLSQPILRVFLSDNIVYVPYDYDDSIRTVLENACHNISKMAHLKVLTEDVKLALIKGLRITARRFGKFTRNRVCLSNLRTTWKGAIDSIMVSGNNLKQSETEGEVERIDAVINCLTNKEKRQALLLMTGIPALCEVIEFSKMLGLLLELSKELDNLPELICEACEGEPLAVVHIGGLLSVKPRAYDTWNEVKDDLIKLRESHNGDTNNHWWHIIRYCYNDLPCLLKFCFLYLACYPIDYEIPARSLTEIWIAEDFITPEEGETVEETANKHLEQLVQRSLVCVTKRSFSGRIKCCRVRQSIHIFAIKMSCFGMFLAANPDTLYGMDVSRLAIHHSTKLEYSDLVIRNLQSFLAFDLGRDILPTDKNLRVLELRKSVVPEIALLKRQFLRYLGLRGSKISELPEDIGDMKLLQTLDVRDTGIETLPESLWTISTLRHVYVNPSPQINGPPSTATILDLQILKTVAVPKSWQENFPQFLINLRKLAISNRDNPDWNSNPYWESISNLLSHMVNLLSMVIIGDNVPSEFVDTRAFSNLETVKSIKLEGKWNCRNLFIDNVKFPSNLTKLTLTNSGLKEDPMPRLERLQALKHLSLQDGAYTGKKMACSANGFAELQFLELKKLDKLENWEVKPMAMSKLTTLRVVQCGKLNNLPDLGHVTDKVIVN